MSTTRWRARSALGLALCCITSAAVGLGTVPADASPKAVLTGDSDVTGPATAVQQAVRVLTPAAAKAGLVFPMQASPKCYMSDSFGDGRAGHSHQGVDIMGYRDWPAGQLPNQEVYAVVDGRLGGQKVDGGPDSELSGNSWRLYSATGKTYYMYAHLSRFAEGLTNGSTVQQGQVIGYVGYTGNPGLNNYHLHFEVHPDGNPRYAIDPYPLLRPILPSGCTSA